MYVIVLIFLFIHSFFERIQSKGFLVSLPVPAFFCLFLPFFFLKKKKAMKKDEKVRKVRHFGTG